LQKFWPGGLRVAPIGPQKKLPGSSTIIFSALAISKLWEARVHVQWRCNHDTHESTVDFRCGSFRLLTGYGG
jgi:hypothetical protein